MHCHDFERILNEQLDARDEASAERDRALEAHAASCPACALVASRYQTLRQVLRALGPAPAAPPGFVQRCREATARDCRPTCRVDPATIRRAALPMAAAAALLAMASVGWWTGLGLRRGPAREPAAGTTVEAGSLTEALASAGSATWDLARETSAPAARVGREVLDAAALGERAAALPLPLPSGPAPDVWETVGGRVSSGVRPLSGTARHAFGFLLGPPPEEPESAPPAAGGA